MQLVVLLCWPRALKRYIGNSLVLDAVLELGRLVSVLQTEPARLLEGPVGTSYRVGLSAV